MLAGFSAHGRMVKKSAMTNAKHVRTFGIFHLVSDLVKKKNLKKLVWRISGQNGNDNHLTFTTNPRTYFYLLSSFYELYKYFISEHPCTEVIESTWDEFFGKGFFC